MLLRLVLIGLTVSIATVFMTTFFPKDPAMNATRNFERHFHIGPHFPFLTSYLLRVPDRIEPGKRYPLLVALHGGYKRSYAAYYAGGDAFQKEMAAFVLMPMAPFSERWADINVKAKTTEANGAIKTALDIVDKVAATYPVNANRIYVTGSSNGAVGTFAAMAERPELFAAGVAINGVWLPSAAHLIRDARLKVYHGSDDPVFPVTHFHTLKDHLEPVSSTVEFIEMQGVGHDSLPAYRDKDLWIWLFNQSRSLL